MNCLECGARVARLDNEHLLDCCGWTLQEYAIRHQLPLDLLVHPDQVNRKPAPAARRPAVCPGEEARAALLGLRWAGLIREQGPDCEIPGEIRRLDLLLWVLERLDDFGFEYRQEYRYDADTHRVVADNLLRAPAANLRDRRAWLHGEAPPPFAAALAVYLAHAAEIHAGYLFLPFAQARVADEVAQRLGREHGIACVTLDTGDQRGALLRSRTPEDGRRLLDLLEQRLRAMPGAWERFHQETPSATVTKELVFDAAHFITDHPAKCSNLHGGRYVLQVSVSGRIDPVTGCVVDYGYLKRVVNRRVVERFDHHTLNYAAAELAWRSSTEMLVAHIWECLIEYLPGLSGLRLYETSQSWCDYRGPGLAEFQARGSHPVLHAFRTAPDAARRRALLSEAAPPLRSVGQAG